MQKKGEAMLIEKTVQEIAELVGGRIVGECSIKLTGVSSLSEATENDVAFLGSEKYLAQVMPSRASVILVPPTYGEQPPAGRAWIVCDDPSYAFTSVITAFTPPATVYAPGIHPTAVVSPSATIGANVHIGAKCVIDDEAKIGDNTVVMPGVYVGVKSEIGADCKIFPNSVINERCFIGNRCILQSGCIIGSDGFGFKSGPLGHEKIPQVGIVQIDDDVEIGANSCIDRARFGRTWIKAGTKVDNLVQIAHNCEIGHCCLIVGQAGIAGSTHLGDGVILAGQSGLSGHLKIGAGTIVMAKAGVTKDTAPGTILMGYPAQDRKEFARERLMIHRIGKLQEELKELKAKLDK